MPSLIPLTFLCDNISQNLPCSDSVLKHILEAFYSSSLFSHLDIKMNYYNAIKPVCNC